MNKKCIGCGTLLQDENKEKEGYVDNLEKDLCQRCFKLKHYGEYKIVSKDNNDYKKIINNISKDSIVVYISDIFYLNLDNINLFDKVLLVLTKRDTLPKSIIDDKIKKYIRKRYNNIIDIEIISSINNYNLDNLLSKLYKYSNKEIYFVGNTNSGKSTLLNKIIKNYTSSNIEITTSMYPSTTLDIINININNNLTIIDTPGLINENSIINNLPNNYIKRFNIKKEVKPRTFQIKDTGSIIIDEIIRIDYNTKEINSMTVYINNGINVKRIGKNNDILKDKYVNKVKLQKNKDVVIDDICFIKFTKEVELNIYLIDETTIKTRDNLI